MPTTEDSHSAWCATVASFYNWRAIKVSEISIKASKLGAGLTRFNSSSKKECTT